MNQKAAAHPFTIFLNLRRVIFLIFIPVLRGLFSSLRGGFSAWSQGAWLDALVLFFMLFLSVLQWRKTECAFGSEGLHASFGLFRRRFCHFPWKNVITLSVVRPFFLKPFRVVRLKVDTLGGNVKETDFTILLSPHDAQAIMAYFRGNSPPSFTGDYLPTTRSILFLSLLTSSSFGGIVFIATFISQAGRILGRGFSDMLIGTMEEIARTLAFGIPPAAAVLAYVLLAGWLLAFFLTFFRYKNMAVSRRPGAISISGGLFTQREYWIKTGEISFLEIRQSLLTKAFRLSSLYVSAVGYGKRKDDIYCVIPTEPQHEFALHMQRLFPGFSLSQRQLKPASRSLFRFTSLPMLLCFLLLSSMFILVSAFPLWRDIIMFVSLMLLIPVVFLFCIRLYEYKNGGISYNGSNYTICYSSGFYIRTVLIHKDKIVFLKTRQSWIQRLNGNCDLLIYSKTEGKNIHFCRNLSLVEVRNLFNL